MYLVYQTVNGNQTGKGDRLLGERDGQRDRAAGGPVYRGGGISQRQRWTERATSDDDCADAAGTLLVH